SDDGSPVDDPRLFRHALEYAHTRDLLVIEHPEDRALSRTGVMHEGGVSARLGLPGIPAAAEETAVARGIALARLTGARLHLTHLSTAGSIELVRHAKHEGVPITCDVTPHHLAMTDAWVAGSRTFAWENGDSAPMGEAKVHRADRAVESAPPAPAASPYDSNTKMNPPLRPHADVRALWAGLADGTVDAIATDHAPHASTKKEVEFDQAANGISGLETALSLVLGGVAVGWCPRDVALRALCEGPARVLGIAVPPDDWIAIDPDAVWRPVADDLATRGKNTPLLSRDLRGRAVVAVVDGEVRYERSVHAAV
ncbi:MAG: dihydroorotase, partial [Chloroflexota bacterium]